MIEFDSFSFSFWAASTKTIIRTEQLIYPLTSLVAEFGGTHGLFLGFSFMTLWDHIQLFGYVTFAFRMFKVYFREIRNTD